MLLDAEIICRDWEGNELYGGEECFIIDGNVVPVEKIEEYLSEHECYKVTIGEEHSW